MLDMPRPRPPHLHRQVSRHGKVVWYVRVGKGLRTRITETFGTPEFTQAYQRALTGEKPPVKKRASAGTIGWLMERYRETQAWTRLSPATRKQRENIFRPVLEKIGREPIEDFDRVSMEASLAQRAATPFQAKDFLDAMRGLYGWAKKAGHAKVDPTEGLSVERPKTDGFKVWTEADVAKFEARWPLGTRERLALDLLLYTGLRRGDVASLGPQHVSNDVITIRTAKTSEIVTLPILPELAATIAASSLGTTTFIAGPNGQPLVKESFGNWFRKACNAADVPGSAHGLRKLGATRAADNGATEKQLEALFGWRGGGMAALYTKAADRRRLAKNSISMMSKPTPSQKPYSLTSQKGEGHKPEK